MEFKSLVQTRDMVIPNRMAAGMDVAEVESILKKEIATAEVKS
jgi:hypothetical protein